MTHCNLHLGWTLLEILRNKRLVQNPLKFTVGMEVFRNLEKQEARALPIVTYSCNGIF